MSRIFLSTLCSFAFLITAQAAESTLYQGADAAFQALLRSNDDSHREQTTWISAPGPTSGIEITCRPGPGYAGIKILPSPAQDLTAFSYLEARVENLGDTPFPLTLRLDASPSGSTEPWNEQGITLMPHHPEILRVVLGTHWGRAGHPIDTKHITQISVFTPKPASECRFRLESLVAGNTPAGK